MARGGARGEGARAGEVAEVPGPVPGLLAEEGWGAEGLGTMGRRGLRDGGWRGRRRREESVSVPNPGAAPR